MASKPHHRTGKPPANKGKTYIPTLLDPSDVQALIDHSGDGLLGLRGRAAIGLMYRTGVSISELTGLTMDHVALDNGQECISILSGGRLRARTLALDAAALALLRPWWEVRQSLPGAHVLCAIEGRTRGQRWSDSSVRYYLRDVLDAAGIEAARLHPHAFRYSLFAELIVEQWPLAYIQAQLGVTSISNFQVFFKHLGLEPPSDEEIMGIIRTRNWTPSLPIASEPQQTMLGI